MYIGVGGIGTNVVTIAFTKVLGKRQMLCQRLFLREFNVVKKKLFQIHLVAQLLFTVHFFFGKTTKKGGERK